MSNFVADVFNQALDGAGIRFTVGDPQEGTEPAQVLLRAYGQCLRQLLRAAHWDFARKMAPLTMLGDASGQTPNVGTITIAPWVYEYAYPVDCMKARFLPANYLNPNGAPAGNIALPDTPQTSVSQPPYGYGMRLVPAPFLLSQDANYPIDPNSNWMEMQGAGLGMRQVILTNVNQAALVYTALTPFPSMWDAQFRAAMVAYLASETVMRLNTDTRTAAMLRTQQIEIAKEKIRAARATNANESGFPQTTDHTPDFIRIRNSGGAGAMGGWGAGGAAAAGVGGMGGILWGSWDAIAFGDGSVF